MEECTKCKGDGLIHQGESIHKICEFCGGTGTVSSEIMVDAESDEIDVPDDELTVE